MRPLGGVAVAVVAALACQSGSAAPTRAPDPTVGPTFVVEGDVLYRNTFATARSELPPVEYEYGRVSYSEGGLKLEIDGTKAIRYRFPILSSRGADQRVAADVVFDGQRPAVLGLICRWAELRPEQSLSKDTVYYLLGVDAAGNHSIVRRNEEHNQQQFLAVSQAPLQLVSAPAANHLEAECVGRDPVRLSLKVNGELVLHTEDRSGGELLTASGAGFLMIGIESAPATAVIKNVVVRELFARR